MLKPSRDALPEYLREGDILESWLFLGWIIHRRLHKRGRDRFHHEFRYDPEPVTPLPHPKPKSRPKNLAKAMAHVICYHQLAHAECAACWTLSPCRVSWLHGAPSASHTKHLKLGEFERARQRHGRKIPRTLRPICPQCGERRIEKLLMNLDAAPLPLGGTLAVLRDGVLVLLKVDERGKVVYDEMDEPMPGKTQAITWRGQH